MAARIWTLEQRQRQARAIRSWEPWQKSTGPNSEEGKKSVSLNAFKGGKWQQLRDEIKRIKLALDEQGEYLEQEIL